MGSLKTFLILILTSALLLPQHNPGAKQIALSNSDIAMASDLFTIFSNPAAIALYNWRESGIFFSPQPLGFSELSNYAAAHTEFTPFGSLGLSLFGYGFSLYKETRIAISYSRNIQNSLFLGVTLNYYHLSIKNYGSSRAFPLDIAALSYITDNIRTAFAYRNINRASWGNEPNQIPSTFYLAISSDFSTELTLNASIEKEIGYKPSVQVGVEFALINCLSLRSGASSFPSRFSAGFGLIYSGIQIDYALFSHNDFGLTHQAGIVFSFPQNNPDNAADSRIQKIKKYLMKQ